MSTQMEDAHHLIFSKEEKNRIAAKAEEEAYMSMGKNIEEKIIAPFALLAGLLSVAHEDEENNLFSLGDIKLCNSLGNLIGLMVYGARQELEIQKAGGYGLYALMSFLKEKKEN